MGGLDPSPRKFTYRRRRNFVAWLLRLAFGERSSRGTWDTDPTAVGYEESQVALSKRNRVSFATKKVVETKTEDLWLRLISLLWGCSE